MRGGFRVTRGGFRVRMGGLMGLFGSSSRCRGGFMVRRGGLRVRRGDSWGPKVFCHAAGVDSG